VGPSPTPHSPSFGRGVQGNTPRTHNSNPHFPAAGRFFFRPKFSPCCFFRAPDVPPYFSFFLPRAPAPPSPTTLSRRSCSKKKLPPSVYSAFCAHCPPKFIGRARAFRGRIRGVFFVLSPPSRTGGLGKQSPLLPTSPRFFPPGSPRVFLKKTVVPVSPFEFAPRYERPGFEPPSFPPGRNPARRGPTFS